MTKSTLKVKVAGQLLDVSPREINVKVRERFYEQKEKWERELKTERIGFNGEQLAYLRSPQTKKDREKLSPDDRAEFDVYARIVRIRKLDLLRNYYNVASLLPKTQLAHYYNPEIWELVTNKDLKEAEDILYKLMDEGGKADA